LFVALSETEMAYQLVAILLLIHRSTAADLQTFAKKAVRTFAYYKALMYNFVGVVHQQFCSSANEY